MKVIAAFSYLETYDLICCQEGNKTKVRMSSSSKNSLRWIGNLTYIKSDAILTL